MKTFISLETFAAAVNGKIWEHPTTGEKRVYLNEMTRESFTSSKKAYVVLQGESLVLETKIFFKGYEDRARAEMIYEEASRLYFDEKIAEIKASKVAEIAEVAEVATTSNVITTKKSASEKKAEKKVAAAQYFAKSEKNSTTDFCEIFVNGEKKNVFFGETITHNVFGACKVIATQGSILTLDTKKGEKKVLAAAATFTC